MSLTSQTRIVLNPNKHKNLSFIGCSGCGAKCCASTLVFASLHDIETVYKRFPIFFMVDNGVISLVLFFQYGKYDGQKCAYLQGDMCGVYMERPYACRAYPFAFDSGSAHTFSIDKDCPHIIDNAGDGMQIFLDGNINPQIVDNFVSQKMVDTTTENLKDTGDFVLFCHQNNLLVPFLEIYPDFKDFQPAHLSKLYVIHPQRTALLRMKYKERFENETFVNAIKATIASISNVLTLQNAAK